MEVRGGGGTEKSEESDKWKRKREGVEREREKRIN